MKYTIKNLRVEFGTDSKCLQFVFDNRYGDLECPQCKSKGKFYQIESRKRFDCVCGFAVSPLASTIFHKSSTPLTLWFHAIFLFASSRNGVSAKELERQLGVTYKTAWRLAKQIRILGEYVRGLVHSNSIEGFWSQLKRSINGTHHSVSPKYLQLYLDEFVWRYSHRGQSLFPLMLATAVKPVSRDYERTFS